MKNHRKLTLFYDGLCPLCEAEIVFLSKRNHAGLLRFVDINSESFASKKTGISCDQAMAEMYGQFEDGELIKGVEVFAQSYLRANLKFLGWIFTRKTLKPYLDYLYLKFAKNRHFISKLIGPTLRKLV